MSAIYSEVGTPTGQAQVERPPLEQQKELLAEHTKMVANGMLRARGQGPLREPGQVQDTSLFNQARTDQANAVTEEDKAKAAGEILKQAGDYPAGSPEQARKVVEYGLAGGDLGAARRLDPVAFEAAVRHGTDQKQQDVRNAQRQAAYLGANLDDPEAQAAAAAHIGAAKIEPMPTPTTVPGAAEEGAPRSNKQYTITYAAGKDANGDWNPPSTKTVDESWLRGHIQDKAAQAAHEKALSENPVLKYVHENAPKMPSVAPKQEPWKQVGEPVTQDDGSRSATFIDPRDPTKHVEVPLPSAAGKIGLHVIGDKMYSSKIVGGKVEVNEEVSNPKDPHYTITPVEKSTVGGGKTTEHWAVNSADPSDRKHLEGMDSVVNKDGTVPFWKQDAAGKWHPMVGQTVNGQIVSAEERMTPAHGKPGDENAVKMVGKITAKNADGVETTVPLLQRGNAVIPGTAISVDPGAEAMTHKDEKGNDVVDSPARPPSVKVHGQEAPQGKQPAPSPAAQGQATPPNPYATMGEHEIVGLWNGINAMPDGPEKQAKLVQIHQAAAALKARGGAPSGAGEPGQPVAEGQPGQVHTAAGTMPPPGAGEPGQPAAEGQPGQVHTAAGTMPPPGLPQIGDQVGDGTGSVGRVTAFDPGTANWTVTTDKGLNIITHTPVALGGSTGAAQTPTGADAREAAQGGAPAAPGAKPTTSVSQDAQTQADENVRTAFGLVPLVTDMANSFVGEPKAPANVYARVPGQVAQAGKGLVLAAQDVGRTAYDVGANLLNNAAGLEILPGERKPSAPEPAKPWTHYEDSFEKMLHANAQAAEKRLAENPPSGFARWVMAQPAAVRADNTTLMRAWNVEQARSAAQQYDSMAASTLDPKSKAQYQEQARPHYAILAAEAAPLLKPEKPNQVAAPQQIGAAVLFLKAAGLPVDDESVQMILHSYGWASPTASKAST